MKLSAVLLLFILSMAAQAALPLLQASDVVFEGAHEGGFFLWIRQKAEIRSVMLTDRSRQDGFQSVIYALRAPQYNPYNGDEKRKLGDTFLNKPLYSLIDSTPESNPYFLEGAFRIYIPPMVVYGYPWTKESSMAIEEGAHINIRTFTEPYGDYSGGYQDTPFVLALTTAPLPPPQMEVQPSWVDLLQDKLAQLHEHALDLVLVFHLPPTEQSRQEVVQGLIQDLTQNLAPQLAQWVEPFSSFRLALAVMQGISLPIRLHRFSEGLPQAEDMLHSLAPVDGQAVAETVYGLPNLVNQLSWQSSHRLLVYISDQGLAALPPREAQPLYQGASEAGIRLAHIPLPAAAK